jgi:ABC-type transport system involved in multi-copper enzyme maturation permease subunit
MAGVLALNVWVEQFRSRFFHLIWVFGGVLLYATLLVGVLAVEQELRVLQDLGLALIELLTLTACAFVAANSILREVEMKTIYLILARPVPRGSYLLGKFLGLQLSVACAALAMAGLHVSLLLLRGWEPDPRYALFLAGSVGKVFLVSALTVLLSLISTSAVSALTMTGVMWTIGHFSQDLEHLASMNTGLAGLLLGASRPLFPDLQALNSRDWWPPEGGFAWGGAGASLAYILLYAGACLAFSWALFRRKEF